MFWLASTRGSCSRRLEKKTCKTEHERLHTFFRLSRERVSVHARGTHCSSKTENKQTYTNVKVQSMSRNTTVRTENKSELNDTNHKREAYL